MEAWLSIPVRLVGVALIAALVFLCFDGVRDKLALAFPNTASAATESRPTPYRLNHIAPVVAGIFIIAITLLRIERKHVHKFQNVVDSIEALNGSIQFDPPATEPSKQYNAKITTVDLSDTKVNDELFPDLNRIPSLKVVRLANTNIGIAAIRAIASCRKLEHIDLSQTKLTSADLVPLSMHRSLRSIIANDTPIDDDAIETLSTCKKLTRIEADNTRLTDEGINTLAASLPMATVSAASVAR